MVNLYSSGTGKTWKNTGETWRPEMETVSSNVENLFVVSLARPKQVWMALKSDQIVGETDRLIGSLSTQEKGLWRNIFRQLHGVFAVVVWGKLFVRKKQLKEKQFDQRFRQGAAKEFDCN